VTWDAHTLGYVLLAMSYDWKTFMGNAFMGRFGGDVVFLLSWACAAWDRCLLRDTKAINSAPAGISRSFIVSPTDDEGILVLADLPLAHPLHSRKGTRLPMLLGPCLATHRTQAV
jgi:hypothetical protein